MSDNKELHEVSQELNDLAIGYVFGVDVGIPGRSFNPSRSFEDKYIKDSFMEFRDKYFYNNPYNPYNHNIENPENPFTPDLTVGGNFFGNAK